MPYVTLKSPGKACQTLSCEGNKHDVGIFGNNFPQGSAEIGVFAGCQSGRFRERKELVQRFFSKAPFFLDQLE